LSKEQVDVETLEQGAHVVGDRRATVVEVPCRDSSSVANHAPAYSIAKVPPCSEAHLAPIVSIRRTAG
jgi:hypothetical protein